MKIYFLTDSSCKTCQKHVYITYWPVKSQRAPGKGLLAITDDVAQDPWVLMARASNSKVVWKVEGRECAKGCFIDMVQETWQQPTVHVEHVRLPCHSKNLSYHAYVRLQTTVDTACFQ